MDPERPTVDFDVLAPRPDLPPTPKAKTTDITIPAQTVPAQIEPAAPTALVKWRRIAMFIIGLCVLAAAVGIGISRWRHRQAAMPAGIVSGNGRLEAEEIDISTKFAGRVLERKADEGDVVQAGQIVARMDTRDLEATLKGLEAQVAQARKTAEEAKANLEFQKAQLTLARQELERTSSLVQKGYATRELYDQRRQSLDTSTAAVLAAEHRVGATEHALTAAKYNAELYKVNIADNVLVAPRAGRIQYRIADIGEVLPAGGKVFTMIDVSDVYMDIYLPTTQAGRVKVGSDARIVLDAWPGIAVPARVSFVATQAQFTPKAVETEDERDKLMFRVKVRVDRDVLTAHAADVRVGLPGRAYVRTDPATAWPTLLQRPLR